MTTLRLAPAGAVGAEDVGDFQGAVRHEEGLRRQLLQRADDLAQDFGGHVGVDGCGLELLVAEHGRAAGEARRALAV